MRLLHGGTFAAAVVTAVMAVASPASAHASLASSDPAADSVLQAAPDQVLLTFTEAVDAVPEAIRVLAADGTEVDIGEIGQNGADTLVAALPELNVGTYLVAWTAVSGDSHPINGAFSFSIGAPSDVTSGLLDDLAAAEPGGAAEVWLGVGRFVSFAGLAVLGGGLLAVTLCAPSLLAARRVRNLLLFAAAIGLAGTMIMICAQASITGAGPLDASAWRAVVDSRSGRWWFSRLPLFVVGAGLVLFREFARTQVWRGVSTGAFALVCGIYAAGGHGISGREVAAGFLATLLHVAAMSLWLGGLVLIVVVERRRTFALAARFSPYALAAVVVLAGTGVFNTWRQMGTLAGFTDSTYGKWLLVKLALVVVVVSVAGTSRYMVRLNGSSDAAALRATSAGAAVNNLDEPVDPTIKRAVVVEVVGVALILAATAGLVNAAPPKEAAGAAAATASSVSVVTGERTAQIVLDPPVAGGTTMHVYVSENTGSLVKPDEITVDAALPDRSLGPIAIPTVPAGPDHVTTSSANLPLAGTWTFTITARYGEFDQVVFTAQMTVT